MKVFNWIKQSYKYMKVRIKSLFNKTTINNSTDIAINDNMDKDNEVNKSSKKLKTLTPAEKKYKAEIKKWETEKAKRAIQKKKWKAENDYQKKITNKYNKTLDKWNKSYTSVNLLLEKTATVFYIIGYSGKYNISRYKPPTKGYLPTGTIEDKINNMMSNIKSNNSFIRKFSKSIKALISEILNDNSDPESYANGDIDPEFIMERIKGVKEKYNRLEDAISKTDDPYLLDMIQHASDLTKNYLDRLVDIATDKLMGIEGMTIEKAIEIISLL